MWRRCVLLLLLCAVWCVCGAQAQYPRPRRPERLHTAQQISNYLRELQEYYSVHGRGRYGKRETRVADSAVMFGEGPLLESDPFSDPRAPPLYR